MSTMIVPFNFQPSSVSVKTASYTIPAGKYAKVQCYFTGSGSTTAATYTQQSATVNGTSVLWEGFRVNRSLSASLVSFTFPSTASGSASIGYKSFFAPSNGLVVLINSYEILNASSAINTFIQTNISGGENASLGEGTNSGVKTLNISFTPLRQSFESWVPAGTVLSGTGTYAWYIEEFNMIS